MNELIKIGNQEICTKEYKDQRVVTFRDIDLVHERPDGTARRNFNTNKKRLEQGEDYFVRNSSEAKLELGIIAPNGLVLITEQGYMMLVKSFTDDLAWKVQRELVGMYFKKKRLLKKDSKHLKPSLSAANKTVQLMTGIYKDAGVAPEYIVLAASNVYKETVGIDLGVPLISKEEKLYDKTTMADKLGILSMSGKPHAQYIGAVILHLDINESEIVNTPYTRHGHSGVDVQYTQSVFDKVESYLVTHNYPGEITHKVTNKTLKAKFLNQEVLL